MRGGCGLRTRARAGRARSLAREDSGCLIYKTNFAGDSCAAGGLRVETVKTVISIDGSVDSLFAPLDSNTRRKVRKAAREGYKVREANEWFGAFHTIYSATLHRLGTPVFRPAVFGAMQCHLGSRMSFYAVERGDELVGGMVCLKPHRNGRAYMSRSSRTRSDSMGAMCCTGQ